MVVLKCPWYEDGICVFDDEGQECIEEYTSEKCNANPNNREYTPMEMEQPDFCRQETLKLTHITRS
jgi:hypothetical protein